MPHRSTQEKRKAQTTARNLFVKDGLSLSEISQQTGETVKTLRAWRNLEDWEAMRDKETLTEFGRLKSLRDSLFDKAEAQLKAGKMPHTEIGLVCKLERIIEQKNRRTDRMVPWMILYTIKYLIDYLRVHDPKLAPALGDHLEQFSSWVLEQDFTEPLK